MTTSNPTSRSGAPGAHEPRSRAEKLEEEASLAGAAAGDTLRAAEVALVVLLGLLVCPPLAILAFVVFAPLFIAAVLFGLVVMVLSAPYLLFHYLRHRDGGHGTVLADRVRHATRALVDLLPHRIVAGVRRLHADRS